MSRPQPGDPDYTRWALFSNAIHNALLECNDSDENWPRLSYRERVAEDAWERFNDNVEAYEEQQKHIEEGKRLSTITVPRSHLEETFQHLGAETVDKPPAQRGHEINGPQIHQFFTRDFDGKKCSRCALSFDVGNHYPERGEPCGCDGCWACAGHVLGCTCDVDWDKVYGHE